MTNLKRTNLITLLVIFTLIIGCEKDDAMTSNCIKGEGTVTTQTLSISEFNGVNLAFSSNVTIKKGATQEVKATGHPNIIDKISTQVSNSFWEIYLDNGCYVDYELSIEITVPDINRLEISGSGNINVNSFINQNDLDITLIGSGNMTLNDFEGISTLDITLSGSGNFSANSDITSLSTVILNNSGSGTYSGFAISSTDFTVNSTGSGNCKITAISTLNATLSGSGDVSNKGTPNITQNITGSGSLIDAN